jgi:hypothetical protein
VPRKDWPWAGRGSMQGHGGKDGPRQAQEARGEGGPRGRGRPIGTGLRERHRRPHRDRLAAPFPGEGVEDRPGSVPRATDPAGPRASRRRCGSSATGHRRGGSSGARPRTSEGRPAGKSFASAGAGTRPSSAPTGLISSRRSCRRRSGGASSGRRTSRPSWWSSRRWATTGSGIGAAVRGASSSWSSPARRASSARLEALVFLAAGDAALTRLARARSRTSAVVVRFSRGRRRSERQGVLVAAQALRDAEHALRRPPAGEPPDER